MKKLILLFILAVFTLANEPIVPIVPVKYDVQKALLGKVLFRDTKLSSDGKISCKSCHEFKYGGADNEKFSTGVNGREGFINSPTVFNAVFNFRQFWNGRVKTLKEQEREPLRNHHEMNMNIDKIEKYIQSVKFYQKEFQKIYNKNPNFNDMLDSIAEFEKALVTPNSKFDNYLRGKEKLSKLEKKGYNIFKSYGCVSCHNGVNVGGNSFQKIGILNKFPRKHGTLDRYAVTKNQSDKNVFKVPTLRNIALTSPYFHNGISKTLKSAIENMAYYNLGFRLDGAETKAIKAFLLTLTGQKPKILNRK